DGRWPQSERPLHVEAAAWHGEPVYFFLISPCTRANQAATQEDKGRAGDIMGLVVALLTAAAGVWFAVRNLTRGRGDRHNAWRLACIAFAVGMTTFLVRVHFIASLSMVLLIILAISTSLFVDGSLWVLYIALE